MSRGTAILLSAAAAAMVLPLTALGLHLPLWLDGVLSVATLGGTYLVVRRPAAVDGLDADALMDARNQTAKGLTVDAAAAVDRLKKVGKTGASGGK